jgi:P-type Ca2+ transporter type 2C
LARSTPNDKLRLVSLLRRNGEVVSVTGDGANDGPALREADVGLSMGKYGTEVSKEASDIVILDDNFASIVNSVAWGRAIFQNIRKFLQVQLTVNVVALATVFSSALLGFGAPLTAVQLLWVNLIMDTLAALALGIEPPMKDVLQRRPHGRHAPLITRAMWFNILSMGLLMFIIMMLILNTDLIAPHADLARNTILFNVFVFLQIWNEMNCRSVGFDQNIFAGIARSKIFLIIIGASTLIQALIVQLGGGFFSTTPLSAGQWLISIALGALALPFGWLLRAIGRTLPARWFEENEKVVADGREQSVQPATTRKSAVTSGG